MRDNRSIINTKIRMGEKLSFVKTADLLFICFIKIKKKIILI